MKVSDWKRKGKKMFKKIISHPPPKEDLLSKRPVRRWIGQQKVGNGMRLTATGEVPMKAFKYHYVLNTK